VLISPVLNKAKRLQKQMRYSCYLYYTVHINAYNYPFHVQWTQGYWLGWLPPYCCWSWSSPLVYWSSWSPSAPGGAVRTWRRRRTPLPQSPMRTISTMRLRRWETVCRCRPARCMPLLRKQSATRKLCVGVYLFVFWMCCSCTSAYIQFNSVQFND